MLVTDKFTADRKPSEETLVGALAVSGGDDEVSGEIAVKVTKVDAERRTVRYAISYYTEPEDVADPETGDFHPGIEATVYSDWSFTVQLITAEELPGALNRVENWDLMVSIPIPELDLILFGTAFSD